MTAVTAIDEQLVVALSTEECWELLEMEDFGHLVFRLRDDVHVVPVNYVVEAGSLLIGPTSASTWLAARLDAEATFETDWHNGVAGWSVAARGRLHQLQEEPALPARAPGLGLGLNVVRLEPEGVSGRRFRLGP